MGIKLGFHQSAKLNDVSGGHQQVSCGELLMNKAWDALPEPYMAMIESAGEAQMSLLMAISRQCSSMPWRRCAPRTKCGSSAGGKELATFEKAWFEVLQEQSAKDPILQKVADDYLDCRKTYAIGGKARELKAGHLD